MVKLLSVGLLACLALGVACGGTGTATGTGTGGDDGSDPVVQEGVFVDSPVQGLSFETETQSGVTDADGTFQFVADEVLRFFIGEISLGEAIGQDLLSPVDLVSGVTSLTDSRELRLANNTLGRGIANPIRNIANRAFLLQILDEDQDVSNGITLPDGLSELASDAGINFDARPSRFDSDAVFRRLLRDGRDAGLWASGPLELNLGDVMNHLYDTLGLVPEISRVEARLQDDDADGTPDRINTSFYNDAGLLERAVDMDNGVIDDINHFHYDERNRLIRQETDDAGDGTIEETQFFVYDELGRLIRLEADVDGDSMPDGAFTVSYDELGNTIEVGIDADNNGMPESTTTSEYDANNNCVLESTDMDGNGTIDRVIMRFYGEQRNEIRRETDDGNDGSIDEVRTTEFNALNLRTLEEVDDGNNGTIDSRSTFEYDAMGNQIRRERDDNADGNPEEVVTRTFDSLGNEVLEEEDTDGNGSIDRRETTEINAAGYRVRREVDDGADDTIDSITETEYEPGTWHDFF